MTASGAVEVDQGALGHRVLGVGDLQHSTVVGGHRPRTKSQVAFHLPEEQRRPLIRVVALLAQVVEREQESVPRAGRARSDQTLSSPLGRWSAAPRAEEAKRTGNPPITFVAASLGRSLPAKMSTGPKLVVEAAASPDKTVVSCSIRHPNLGSTATAGDLLPRLLTA